MQPPGPPAPPWASPPAAHPAAPRPAVPGGARAAGAPRPPGFFRRNRWGLILLVPALVGAFWAPAKNAYDTYRFTPNQVPMAANGAGWVSYDGGQVRLIEVGQATFKPRFGVTPSAPAGTTAWRALLRFSGAAEKAFLGCEVELEDARGRRYAMNPSEISGLGALYAVCTPGSDASGTPEYDTEAYFVMPAGARPVAVRISTRAMAPNYVRLTVG
ncbi:hypothetical protein [Rhizomonospora bruguierae]|uniref:hypothetical protein n=1 Tax=Rhizomonospora bruguierae TaxID=1581705 RepID=UPI001BCB58C0|nr:hypothetical protein [Micromonospora sp. NBRC 107566]